MSKACRSNYISLCVRDLERSVVDGPGHLHAIVPVHRQADKGLRQAPPALAKVQRQPPRKDRRVHTKLPRYSYTALYIGICRGVYAVCRSEGGSQPLKTERFS